MCWIPTTKTGTAGRVRTQAGRNETEEQALERRLLESAQVEQRVELIETMEQLKEQLKAANDKLVVLEVCLSKVREHASP